jgi:Ca-activated chloride channel family protein
MGPAEWIGDNGKDRGSDMKKGTGGYRGVDSALADFIQLVGKAIAGGVAASLFFALCALGLATSAGAQTRPNDAKTGTLLFRAGPDGAFQPAPKVETDVTIHVTGLIARTRVAQTFHNPGTATVEGVYVFPLPENAAVDRLRLRVGEQIIEGQVREKEAARREYAQAKAEGRKASLVEQQRPNLFTNAVANIGAGEFVRVVIEYQQSLAFEGGEYRLRFPLAITPRYVPAGGGLPEEPKTVEPLVAAGLKADDAEPLLHPHYVPASAGAANPVSIGVVIDSPVPLAKVTSSYQDAWVEKDSATRTVLYLQKEQVEADRDFELVFAPRPGEAPVAGAWSERVGDTDYALLMVVPPAPAAGKAAARLPRETVFVIDTSGSMQGRSIVQAKEALATGLSTLTQADRFNLVEFNSVTRTLWPAAMPVTESNLALAREWVGRLKADGGTEMAPALAFALGSDAAPGFLRQVVFITDGAVGNEDQLFKLIATKLGSTRLFTVGIGSAPNSHFMTKAAQFGRGTFTYIGDTAEVGTKMGALFAKIESPVLKDVQVRWADGTAVETFPPRVPDLYLGEPLVVAAAAPAIKGTIVVSGLRGNEPWSVALTPAASDRRTGVGALWARAKIASLMDDLRLGADEAQVRPAVLKVALDHHLVSRYTSLVAVDVTPTVAPGASATALVPASAPHGAGELPQTDAETTLHLLLGLLALVAAGTVAWIGRAAVPAERKVP